jgi:hypothetical protein
MQMNPFLPVASKCPVTAFSKPWINFLLKSMLFSVHKQNYRPTQNYITRNCMIRYKQGSEIPLNTLDINISVILEINIKETLRG